MDLLLPIYTSPSAALMLSVKLISLETPEGETVDFV